VLTALCANREMFSMRTKEASDYLQEKHGVACAPATLDKLVTVGGGPAYRKKGRFRDYTPGDLDAYAASKTSPVVRSSSELRALNAHEAA
jgi:hypothetical protein